MKPKTKIYIDGANMFYTQKKLKWFFDWEIKLEASEYNYLEDIKDKIARK